jgi:hypothetical protein
VSESRKWEITATAEPTIFDRGDLVWCLVSAGYWKRGIVTDVFRAPITNREVVVVGGDGYYVDDVMPDTGEGMPVPEPQSLRA